MLNPSLTQATDGRRLLTGMFQTYGKCYSEQCVLFIYMKGLRRHKSPLSPDGEK